MDKKYIVKNCPCIYTGWKTMYKCFHYNNPCKECTDCLIKQVVEDCREVMRFERKSNLGLATDLMHLFEIERVNNDK